MQDNVNYWVKKENLEWYRRQFKNPYRITIAFEKFLNDNCCMDNARILDVACGNGSSTAYIAEKHPTSCFTGIDINTELFELFEGDRDNINLEYGDIYNIDEKHAHRYNGIMCIQTLSWLPNYKEPLEEICRQNAEWIAFSSLLYDGNINYTILLENYNRPTEKSAFSCVNYNVYSVQQIKELLSKYGYNNVIYKKFEIDIDIAQPEHGDLGYYTIKCDDGKRLAFNTCLYQPEGFIFASKN